MSIAELVSSFLDQSSAPRETLEAALRETIAHLEVDPAAAALHEAIALVHARWDHARRSEALGVLVRLHAELAVRRGDFASACQYYIEASRELFGLLAPVDRAQLALDQAWVYHCLGDYLTSLDLCREAAHDLRAVPETNYQAALLHSLRGINQYRLGGLDEALWEHGEALVLREALGDELGKAASLNNLGNVHLDRGAWDEATDCYQASRERYAMLGRQERVATLENNLGNLAAYRGDFEQAEEHHKRALRLRSRLGDRFGAGASRCALAQARLRSGRVGEAIDGFRRGLRLIEVSGASELKAEALLGLGNALMLGGDLNGARYALAAGRDAAQRTHALLQLGAASLGEARLARLEGLLDLALEHLSKARQHLSKASSRFELARGDLEAAHVHHARHDRDAAREALERALATFQALGAKPELIEAQALGERLGARVARAEEREA